MSADARAPAMPEMTLTMVDIACLLEDESKHADLILMVANLQARVHYLEQRTDDVARLRSALANLVAALPDTRRILIAREDANNALDVSKGGDVNGH